MKKLIALFLALAMVLSLAACAGSDTPADTSTDTGSATTGDTADTGDNAGDNTEPADADKQTIRVGVSVPITSSSEAESAQNLEGGIRAAIEYAQDQGMLDAWNIELFVEDDAADPTTGMNAANKLVYTDNIHVLLGPVQSTVASVILPMLEEEQIPSIMAVASPDLSQLGYTYFFRANYTNSDVGQISMRYFVEELGYTNIGVLAGQNETSEAALAAVEETLSGYGLEPVVQYFADTDTDFSSQIMALRDAGCEAVFSISTIVAGAQQAEQIRQLMGAEPYIIGLSNGQTSYLDLIGAEMANRSGYVTCYDPCFEGELYDTFREYYAHYVDREAVDVSARGYDAMMILITALNSMDNPNADEETFGEQLRDAIRAVDYTGLQGQFQFDETGDGLKSASIVEYVDGERVQLG